MRYVPNLLLKWSKQDGEANSTIERVLWVDASGTDVAVIDVTSPKALPFWRRSVELDAALKDGQMSIVDVDEFVRPVIEDMLPDRHKAIRDRAWELIKDLVQNHTPDLFDARIRGPLIALVAMTSGVKKDTIYKYLRRWWQGGQTPNALLPHYYRCGNPGVPRPAKEGAPKRGRPRLTGTEGVNVDEVTFRKILLGIRLFLENPDEPSIKVAYQRTVEKFFNAGEKELEGGVKSPIIPEYGTIPSLEQFKYYCGKKYDISRRLKARHGEREYNLKFRGMTGDSTGLAFGPGSMFQIDATMADVYLVSSFDRSRIIGRPILYIVIDVFSRLVVGFSVSLEGPNWLGAMLALDNAVADKVEFCKQYGITITEDMWPSRYLPEVLLADRGEFEGYNANNLVQGLNVTIQNTAPYRADWKAIVERHFRLTNEKVLKWVPGSVPQAPRRGGKDYRLDAVLDLHQFRQLIIYSILEHNTAHWMKGYRLDEYAIQDRVRPIPVDLWHWGVRNRSGHLRVMSRDVVRMNLLPRGQASVTPSAIEFQGRRYMNELAKAEGWTTRARNKGRWRVNVAYDPRNLDVIYLIGVDSQRLVPAYLVDSDGAFRGRDLFEALDLEYRQRKAEEANRTAEMQALADLHAQVKHVIKVATVETKRAAEGLSKTERTQGIRENRREERELERRQESWVSVDERVTASTVTPEGSPADEQEYIAPPTRHDELREIRDRRRSAHAKSSGERAVTETTRTGGDR